jgi:predicted metalloprotease with PDZ domain
MSALSYRLNPAVELMKVFLLTCLCLVLAGCESVKQASNVQVIETVSGSIRIEMARDLPVPREAVVEWVRRGAVAVTTYLGKFPVKHLVVTVYGGGEEPIGDGVTHGASSIEVRLGRFARVRDLNEDWIMTHEMFHLAFPTLNRRYLWMMEGLSDYLEPIARAQASQWRAEDAWREFVDGLPQGLPEPGEGGLDNSKRRERIYWGGNIYWLLADVQIRAQTNNRHGIDDVIHAILAEGGNGGAEWPIERVLAVGNKATGTTVLKELYEQLGTKPGHVDLAELWKKLGVRESGRRIIFDDQAPWAKYREAITARSNR